VADSFLTRVTAPAAPLLSLPEVKQHIAIDHNDDDAMLDGIVAAANDWMDGEAGVLGRALVTQTWRLTLSAPPRGRALRLPIPIVQSVSAITYYDETNTQQTLAADQYRLVSHPEYGLVELVDGANWPNTYRRADAMSVEYVTGYGDTAADVPQAIRQAAALLAAYWYDNRSVATERSMSEMPMGVQSLLMNYRLARGHI